MPLWGLPALVLMPGCLPQDPATDISSSAGSALSDISFAGATSAQNVSGTAIAIDWDLPSDSSIKAFNIYEVSLDEKLTRVGRVTPPLKRFIHAGLMPGTVHYYVVRAANSDDTLEDKNNVMVQAIAYAGITNAVTTGTTSATVTFPAATEASEIRVYGEARGSKKLLTTVSSAATSASVSGLRSGVTYAFSVKAVTPQGNEDSNTLTKYTQTVSESSTAYKGVVVVQAFGNSPGAPSGQPSTRQVKLTWVAFSGSSGSTVYAVERVLRGGTLDMTVTEPCTSSTTGSCRVACEALMGSGSKTCTDTNVASSPAQYDYAVTLVKSDWVEELPADDQPYRITAAIPPDNMALVHRDSANYEMCKLMGKTPDPMNHQRCAYTGLGGQPYNSNPGNPPLGLESGYYDLGYNLFVDRWEAACNWTPGACAGSGAPNGDCYGNGAPASGIGSAGNVYYRYDSGECYLKTNSSTWISGDYLQASASQRAALYTNAPDPTHKRPPIVNIKSYRAWDICQAVVDPDYGAKRLPRHREFIAAAAWPWLSNEPNAMTDAAVSILENGSQTHAAAKSCNTNTANGISVTSFNTSGYELSTSIAGGPKSFTIGSTGTSRCVSRYGIQDLVGNVNEWMSDQLSSCNSSTHSCYGMASSLDSGNQDMSNFNFDGLMGPGGATTAVTGWDLSSPLTYPATPNFLPPLGLPVVSGVSGSMKIGSGTTELANSRLANDYFKVETDAATTTPVARVVKAGNNWIGTSGAGRFSVSFSDSDTFTASSSGFRCVLPAD